MVTNIIQIGNSKGIILPSEVLKQLRLSLKSAVSISLDGNNIVIKAQPRQGWADPYRVLCSVAGRDGEIATDQIRTVDKSRLKRKIGDLNFSEIKRLKEVFHQMFCE